MRPPTLAMSWRRQQRMMPRYLARPQHPTGNAGWSKAPTCAGSRSASDHWFRVGETPELGSGSTPIRSTC